MGTRRGGRLPQPLDAHTLAEVPATSVDVLLDNVLHCAEDGEEGMRRLYGPPRLTGKGQRRVWTDGSALNNGTARARATGAAYFAHECSDNCAARVPGKQTNNRGEHLGLILALLATQPDVPLVVYSDSENVIHTYCHWARGYEQTGWRCANADLIVYAVTLLQRRPAGVEFRWIKGHSGNAGKDAADTMARRAA
ncbi:ribonuclease H-like domain-containing protein, partial [Schizophyllum amplum]